MYVAQCYTMLFYVLICYIVLCYYLYILPYMKLNSLNFSIKEAVTSDLPDLRDLSISVNLNQENIGTMPTAPRGVKASAYYC